LPAEAVEEGLESVGEAVDGVGVEGGRHGGGDVGVIGPVDHLGELGLPGSRRGEFGLGLLFDRVAEHVVVEREDDPAGPFRREAGALQDLEDHVSDEQRVGTGDVGAGHYPGSVAMGEQRLAEPPGQDRQLLIPRPFGQRTVDALDEAVGDRFEQRFLVGEVPVEGGAVDVEAGTELAGGQAVQPFGIEQFNRPVHHIRTVQQRHAPLPSP
jgi:hypothetical protein